MKQLRLLIPKGRIQGKVVELLNEAGYGIEIDDNVYLPRIADRRLQGKLCKPQNIPGLVALGSYDIGFTGHDWVMETGARVREVLDLGLDAVSIVAAVPENFDPAAKAGRLKVASEFENLCRSFLRREKINYRFLRTYGATEVFPPDDADMIVDIMASGRTLAAHKLVVWRSLLDSSTRLIANPAALKNSVKKEIIAELAMMLRAVLDARARVMVEMNVPGDRFAGLAADLPCMRAPTVAPLYNESGFAVKVAVPRQGLHLLISDLKRLGARDIIVTSFQKVVL